MKTMVILARLIERPIVRVRIRNWEDRYKDFVIDPILLWQSHSLLYIMNLALYREEQDNILIEYLKVFRRRKPLYLSKSLSTMGGIQIVPN